jgi:hypothetical protein
MKDLVQQLRGFVKQRQMAYKAIMQKGNPVPAMRQKREAIEGILAQLDFIEGKPFHTQKLCIAAITPKFKAILPYEFGDNKAQLTLREKITNILAACDDSVNAKPLFS